MEDMNQFPECEIGNVTILDFFLIFEFVWNKIGRDLLNEKIKKRDTRSTWEGSLVGGQSPSILYHPLQSDSKK